MSMLLAVVFASTFLVAILLMFATGEGVARRTKQTLANLNSALASSMLSSGDQTIDVRRTDLFSSIPWINRFLMRIELAPHLRTLLVQANLDWTAGRLLLTSAACFMISAYLVYLRTEVILFSFVIGVVFGYAPFAFVLHKRTSRFNQFEQGLPEALDLMVSALRAGHSLIAALRLVAHESPDPIGAEFRICFEEQNYGLELRTALENLTNRVPLQDLRIVATAILIQKESGGNLAEVLDKAAQVIRDRFRLKRQVRVHTAQGRLTGAILTLLPLVLGIALYLVNPATMSILWTRPIGLKLLYTAAAMTITGGLIIRQIVNMEV
jgi:tight adherence protein B